MGKLSKVIKALNKRRFVAASYDTMDEAISAILKIISPSESVGTGGSVTLGGSGVLKALRDNGSEVVSYMLDDPKDDEDYARMRDVSMTKDWFLSSSNAITEDGTLVNIDGRGNRVAALAYGESKVLVLAGKNKIVKDYDKAIKRIKTKSCGSNSRRLGISTPCAKDDKCHNCSGKNRICNVTSIIEYPHRGREFHIIIVKEKWGY